MSSLQDRSWGAETLHTPAWQPTADAGPVDAVVNMPINGISAEFLPYKHIFFFLSSIKCRPFRCAPRLGWM